RRHTRWPRDWSSDVCSSDLCVISKQPQIEKIRSARQKFERCKISFVERSGIRPHPANAMLFQKPDELWPMPSGMTKFDCETEIRSEERRVGKECRTRWARS